MNIKPLNRTKYAIFYILNCIFFLALYVFASKIHPYLAVVIYIIQYVLFVYFAAGRLKDLGIDPRWAAATIIPLVCFVLLFPQSKSETASRIK